MQKDFQHLKEVEEEVTHRLCSECKWSTKQGFLGRLFRRSFLSECNNPATWYGVSILGSTWKWDCVSERDPYYDCISKCGSTGKLWEAKCGSTGKLWEAK